MNKPELPEHIPLLPDLPGIIAFSTTRGPGADIADPYSGFSICHYTGDAPHHYMACRRELASALGLPLDRLIIPRQVHGSAVSVLPSDKSNCELCIVNCELDKVDALVTNRPGVALCINTADCVPVLLADPEARVIAAAHCGWRGIVAPLLDNTVEAMTRLGASPVRIRAAMGPSICPACFEVGPEVAAQFKYCSVITRNDTHQSGSESELQLADYALRIVNCEFQKPHIDLSAAITARLIGLGLQEANITPPPACSRCNPGRFFSARHSGIASGRTLTLITLPA